MKKRSPIALVVHGHFYQPPRENPWTDEVARETTAAPFANWNARIHAECYRANAYARIFGGKDHISSIVNNYARLSFDIGPTLARWLARHDSQVTRRIRAGNDDQRTRLGFGGAMAQVWGHAIAPLLSPRDLRTQILWGQADFRHRFGHDADGLWLPETATNEATLAALIDAGVSYTIIAPEQIEAVRPDGSEEWLPVTKDTVDTGRTYRFFHPDGSGRYLALGVFDGPLSRDLAFGQATRDAASFLAAMQRSAERSKAPGKRLVLAASDGELYGHHKKFADLTLAYALGVAAPAEQIEVTNLGAFLDEIPPTWEARLRPGPNGEGTAWSCSHGLGRWLRDCGCRMHDVKGSSQAWRAPLRHALDRLRDRAAVFFEDAGGDLFVDPWRARDAYGDFIDEPPHRRVQRLRRLGRPALTRDRGQASVRALTLMEMQRSLLLMYTSCAWFFDDIAGPETAIALRRAAHAMELWKRLGGKPPLKSFTATLAKARSNHAELGTGADAFTRARRARVAPAQAVARAAFSCMASSSTGGVHIPGFTVEIDCPGHKRRRRTLAGQARVLTLRTGEVATLGFAASHDGLAKFDCQVEGRHLDLDDLDEEAAQALRLGALVRMAAPGSGVPDCRTLLAVADKLGACTPGERSAVAGLLARALAAYLEKCLAAGASPSWSLAAQVADRAGAVQPTDDWRRVQETVWEHLEALRKRSAEPPKSLRILAERLALLRTPAPTPPPTPEPAPP
jgi:alpha-amylase/alpha-mannosidase (GH57 family)